MDKNKEEKEEETKETGGEITPLPPRPGTVGIADFSETLGRNFMVYAKTVIVDRALPSIDGLKPVQRRILLAMNDLRLGPTSRYSKCAKVVGYTLGSYHPHGDASVYGAMVNMAQDFTMRMPLVDGHGSFGSIDGDAPAAMRYTEARLKKSATDMLADLDPEILPNHYKRNFDESMLEPELLPTRFPNILINGGTGIAVGMATTILPHNPEEIMNLCIWRATNPDGKLEEMVDMITGPDFPTGATIVRDEGLKSSYLHGKGKVTALAKAHIEQLQGNREKIVITEIPWAVNKGDLLIKIAKQHTDGKFPEIVELNDLSKGDHGIRIEAVLKWGANAKAVLQRLLTSTGLRKVYGVEMNVLIDGRPKTLNIGEIMDYFLAFRREVVINRAKKRVGEIETRLHKLGAYTTVVDHTDEVVATIKKSQDRQSAKAPLKKLLKIDEQQAQWIVEMQLGQLTQLDRSKLLEEVKNLKEELDDLKDLISSPKRITQTMTDEFIEIKSEWKKAGFLERITSIQDPDDAESDLGSMHAPSEDCLLLISKKGRAVCGQGTLRRGASLNLDSDDRLQVVQEASTDQEWLIFSNQGKAYRLRLAELPHESRKTRGAELEVAIGFSEGEEVVFAEKIEKETKGDLLVVSKKGVVKRLKREDLSSVHSGGVAYAKPSQDDSIFYVGDCGEDGDVVLLGDHGKMICFPGKSVRIMGRTAAGVRGIKLPEGSSLAGVVVLQDASEEMLFASSGGFAKRVPNNEIPRQGRGGGGVITMKVGGKYGEPVFAAKSKKGNELWIDMGGGRLKHAPLSKVPLGKRATVPKRWPGEKAVGVWALPEDGKG